jgi:hypothetical protein
LGSYSGRSGWGESSRGGAERSGATFGEALQSGKGLATVPLLDTDVEVVLAGSDVCGIAELIVVVSERVWKIARNEGWNASCGQIKLTERVEILNAHTTGMREMQEEVSVRGGGG